MTAFAHPEALALLLAPLALLLVLTRRRGPAIVYSSSSLLERTPRSFRQRLLWLPPALRLTCLALLAVAIARPQLGVGASRTFTKGVAIEIVLDRSTSMSEPLGDRPDAPSRYEAAIRAVRDFVKGDDQDLPGRAHDPIGVVAFARRAHTVCPLTRAHKALLALTDRTRIVRSREADGTAIGEAIGLAAARLEQAGETLARQNARREKPELTIKSKAIVLLTDGRNNAGELTPQRAARLCAEKNIKIYAIGLGAGRSIRRTPFGDVSAPISAGADEPALRRLAERTGGEYWPAADPDALRRAYARLDALEKTEIETTEPASRRERFPPLAIGALAVALIETLASATALRRIP